MITKLAGLTLAALLAAGCGTSSTSTDAGTSGLTSDPQRPPAGEKDVEAWLANGLYKKWKCEGAAHDSRSPSPHKKNRICSNDALSAATGGEYPVDAAAVKELYDTAGATITGYAVYRHVKAGTTGDTWYWYERTDTGKVADGTGGDGAPKNICVACHQAAGSDGNHSGHDFVYTQVK